MINSELLHSQVEYLLIFSAVPDYSVQLFFLIVLKFNFQDCTLKAKFTLKIVSNNFCTAEVCLCYKTL